MYIFTTDMKTIHYIYALIILFLGVIGALALTPVPIHVTGQVHDVYNTMLKGGTSMSVDSTTKILAYLFGLCATGTLCLFLILGAVRKGRLDGIRPWLILASVSYLVVFTFTHFSDVTYVATEHNQFFLGWPTPTAWMIYAMWATPVLFVFIYIFKFRDWILTDEDEARFKELVEARRAAES